MGGKLSSEDNQTPASPGGETESVVPPPSSSTGNEFVDLLGPTLLTKEGEKPTAEVLAGKKHVMLYFSAHWCPPCRGYTPQLSKAYQKSSKKGDTAVVFVSSDRDASAFSSYYKEMSFFAVPFKARDTKAKLGELYGVSGIPTLVLLDGTAKLVKGNVRGQHSSYL